MRSILLGLVLFSTVGTWAQSVPPLINYQGRLANSDGTPFPTGDYELRVSLFDAATNGNRLWGPQIFDGGPGTGHRPRPSVLQGYFNLAIGPEDVATNTLVDALSGPDCFVEIVVSNRPPILPRQRILSVPFSIRAMRAQSAARLESPIVSNQISAGAVGSETIANGAIEDRHVKALSKLTVSGGGLNAVVVDGQGRVGVGTSTPNPGSRLDVAGLLKIGGMAQQSLGPNGHIQIGDLIVQWGREVAFKDIVESSTTTFTFPTAFPNEVFVVVPGFESAQQTHATTIAVRNSDRFGVTLGWNEWGPVVQQVRATYIAIGR